ncbi:MAG: B12-binding domain-containing radical SAM protein, partial [Candidatus Omnitrophota bacterium]
DFCYKDSFYKGGRSFYTQAVDDALREINRLPGRHVFFLDDHLFGDERFAEALFDGMRGMNRLWQAAGTVASALKPRLIEKAVACGLRSLFIGFESVRPAALTRYNKRHNVFCDYEKAVASLHQMGVMINGSFVFGMDDEGPDVFPYTVDWAIRHSIETATFHILTPYPGTALFDRMQAERRLLHTRWDLYDTRHAVYLPLRMTPEELEEGYWTAYRDFYRWGSIVHSAGGQESWAKVFRHLMYCGAWKKCEPAWNFIIKCRRIGAMRPLMEALLSRLRQPDIMVEHRAHERVFKRGCRFFYPGEEMALPFAPGERERL